MKVTTTQFFLFEEIYIQCILFTTLNIWFQGPEHAIFPPWENDHIICAKGHLKIPQTTSPGTSIIIYHIIMTVLQARKYGEIVTNQRAL